MYREPQVGLLRPLLFILSLGRVSSCSYIKGGKGGGKGEGKGGGKGWREERRVEGKEKVTGGKRGTDGRVKRLNTHTEDERKRKADKKEGR